jgi:hypothetical protein
MSNLYKVTFTEDKGETLKYLTFPARTLTEAYIEVQLKFPNAEITEIEDSEKVLKIFDKRTGREV